MGGGEPVDGVGIVSSQLSPVPVCSTPGLSAAGHLYTSQAHSVG